MAQRAQVHVDVEIVSTNPYHTFDPEIDPSMADMDEQVQPQLEDFLRYTLAPAFGNSIDKFSVKVKHSLVEERDEFSAPADDSPEFSDWFVGQLA